MLSTEGGNPEVVRGDRPARFPQLQSNGGIVMRSLVIDLKNRDGLNPLSQPALILDSTPGLGDAHAILPQNNNWNRQSFGVGNYFQGVRIEVGSG